MRTGQLLQGSNRFLDVNLNTLCYFFFQLRKNQCRANPHVIDVLMDPNNDTIHAIYLVLLSTNPDKAVEYEATIVIILQFLATTGLPKSILKFATLAMLPTFILRNKY